MKEFTTAWNRCVRRLLRLPHMTHTRYLPHLIGTPGVTDIIYCRFLKMCSSMMMSSNHRVNFLFKVSVSNPKSIIRGNLRLIEKRLDMNLSDVIHNGAGLLKRVYKMEASDSDIVALDFIKQLRSVIHFNDCVPGFNNCELIDILHFVCQDSL